MSKQELNVLKVVEPVAWLAGEVCGGDASHNTVNVALDNPAPWCALPIGAKVAIQSPQTAGQQPPPDVTGLVEALEHISNMDSMSYHSLESAKIVARKTLAAHRKQQESNDA